MARPRKGEEKTVGSYVGSRVSKELRASLDDIANANGRELSEEVRRALEAHVRKESRGKSK